MFLFNTYFGATELRGTNNRPDMKVARRTDGATQMFNCYLKMIHFTPVNLSSEMWK